MARGVRTWRKRQWTLRHIPYDEQPARLDDGKHQGARTKSGFLFVLRKNGNGWNRSDVEHLTPEEFQRALAMNVSGTTEKWNPLSLFETTFDSDYLTVKEDPNPAERRRWLALRGDLPPAG